MTVSKQCVSRVLTHQLDSSEHCSSQWHCHFTKPLGHVESGNFHHQGGFAQSSLNLALAKYLRVPFAESFEPYNETEQLLVQASQLLEGLEVGATSCADATVSGTIDDLLLKASQQLECSSEEPAQQASPMNLRRSLHNMLLQWMLQLLGKSWVPVLLSFMYVVYMCGLVIFGSQVSSFIILHVSKVTRYPITSQVFKWPNSI